ALILPKAPQLRPPPRPFVSAARRQPHRPYLPCEVYPQQDPLPSTAEELRESAFETRQTFGRYLARQAARRVPPHRTGWLLRVLGKLRLIASRPCTAPAPCKVDSGYTGEDSRKIGR